MIRRTLDWKAACLFVRTDPQWRKHLFVGGLWLMLCPPVGWLMALGYRKEVVMNLVHGKQPVLPVWKGQHGFFFREGCKAVGIILSYFTPFFVGFWVLGMEPGVLWVDHLWAFVAFFAFIVVLAPVFLPAAPIWYVEQYDWFALTSTEMGLLAALFVVTTYVIPAGFMQVSRSGRFRDALRLDKVYEVLWHHGRSYTEAWVCSGCMTAAALASGPLAPFGIVWSYQGIVYCFNEVLARSSVPDLRARLDGSHFGAMAKRGAPTDPEALEHLLGLERSVPRTCSFDEDPWVIDALSVTKQGIELTLHGHQTLILKPLWRPQLSIRGGWFVHFFDFVRNGDALELKRAGAAIRLGAIYVPLPARLTPIFRPKGVA